MPRKDKNDEPAYDELADEFDELDWDVEKHGRMKNAPELDKRPPKTVLWVEGEDV